MLHRLRLVGFSGRPTKKRLVLAAITTEKAKKNKIKSLIFSTLFK
jgi:hypothetical protein